MKITILVIVCLLYLPKAAPNDSNDMDTAEDIDNDISDTSCK